MPESLRPLYWKILLNYLPLKKPLWNDVLAEKRKLYKGKRKITFEICFIIITLFVVVCCCNRKLCC